MRTRLGLAILLPGILCIAPPAAHAQRAPRAAQAGPTPAASRVAAPRPRHAVAAAPSFRRSDRCAR